MARGEKQGFPREPGREASKEAVIIRKGLRHATMAAEIKLAQGHYKVFQAQTAAYHRLLSTQHQLDPSRLPTPTSKEYRFRQLQSQLAEQEETRRLLESNPCEP